MQSSISGGIEGKNYDGSVFFVHLFVRTWFSSLIEHLDKICRNSGHITIATEYEPHCEKNSFLHMRKQRRRSDREADQHLCFRYTDSAIPKSEISSL